MTDISTNITFEYLLTTTKIITKQIVSYNASTKYDVTSD